MPVGSPAATLADGTEDTDYVIDAADLLQGFSDVDGDVLSGSNLIATVGDLVDNGNGTYTLTPPNDFNGNVDLMYEVTDGSESIPAVQTVTLASVNDDPIVSTPIEDQVISPNTPFNLDISANFSDVDGDSLAFEASGLPRPITLDPATGEFSGSFRRQQILEVSVTASDGIGTAASDTFELIVTNNTVTGGDDIIVMDTFGSNSVNSSSGNDIVFGTDNDDQINGGRGRDTIYGGAGADTISGRTGADVIEAGDGNDTIQVADANAEFDIINGGEGNDSVVNVSSNRRVTLDQFDSTVNSIEQWDGSGRAIQGNAGRNILDFSNTTLVNVPAILGGDRRDVITASNSTANVTYNGGDDNDVLNGGDQADILLGGTGDDTIVGGAGDDRLRGGPGNDQLTGDLGDDVFVMARGNGADVITDFTQGSDLIDVSAIGITSLNQMTFSGDTVIFNSLRDAQATLTGIAVSTLVGADFVFA